MYRRYGKRIIDFLLSLCLLVLLLPVFIVLALYVRFKIGTPILYSQKRAGKKGEIFTIFKFRTMENVYDENGQLLTDTQRLTPAGNFLRLTSLDELPELFNVLKGDMSLVGPRPLLVEYLEHYTPEQMRRHDVLPGITGLAQIMGRNALTWEDRFEFDIRYVDRQSLRLDLIILALTAWKVIRREGISEQGRSTMSRFTGTK